MGGGENLGRETTIETGGDLWHPGGGHPEAAGGGMTG
jgi:hypothetical protein